MKSRRITITAFRRRRTIVLPDQFVDADADTARTLETVMQLDDVVPEPASLNKIQQRRIDYERKNETERAVVNRDGGFRIFPKINLRSIRQRLFGRPGERS